MVDFSNPRRVDFLRPEGNNNNFITNVKSYVRQVFSTSKTQRAKTQKEREEEMTRMSVAQLLQAAAIYAPLLQRLQESDARILIPLTFLKRGRIDTAGLQLHSRSENGTPDSVEFAAIMQNLLKLLQEKMSNLGLLIDKVNKLWLKLQDFLNRYSVSLEARMGQYQQFVAKLVNAIELTFSPISEKGEKRVFTPDNLSYILGAAVTPSAPPLQLMGLPTYEQVGQIDGMTDLLLKEFPYQPESSQYENAHYQQIVQNISHILVVEQNLTATDVQTSPAIRQQVGMILRPEPSAPKVQEAQEELQAYSKKAQQQESPFADERKQLAQEVEAMQSTVDLLRTLANEIETLYSQAQSVMDYNSQNAMVGEVRRQFNTLNDSFNIPLNDVLRKTFGLRRALNLPTFQPESGHRELAEKEVQPTRTSKSDFKK